MAYGEKQPLVDELTKRYELLKAERERHEDVWEDITEHVLPRIADIREDSRGDAKSRVAKVYDSTGAGALRLWANGIQGYLTPRNNTWMQLHVADRQLREEKGVRKWTQEVTEAIHDELRDSNFYDALAPTLEHGAAVGTAVWTTDWDETADKLLFVPRHPKQVWIAENHRGRVDTVYTLEQMTWRQIEANFGTESLDQRDIEQIRDNPYEYQDVLHCVYPRTERMEHKADAVNKPIASVWILLDRNCLLRESGYDWPRDIAWRFRVGPGEVYGGSPSHDALIDVLRADKVARNQLMASDLSVLPPVQYPAEMGGKLKLEPRGMNPYYDVNRRIEPIPLVGNVQVGLQELQHLEQRIRDHYHIDFWLMLSQSAERQRTAYEVAQLAGEKAAIMGTEIGRVESELLDPTLETVVRLLFERGRLPMPPKHLESKIGGMQFSYNGPLAQLQKLHYGQQNTIQMLSQATLVMQVFPQAADWVDDDQLMLSALEALGAPEDLIRDKRTVEQMRAQRAQMQQMQAQMEMQEKAAQTQKTLAEAARAGGAPGGQQMQGGVM